MENCRRFAGWDTPLLHSAVALLADASGHPDQLHLGHLTVALPGARAGRRLRELLVAEAEERALRLVPPRITTMGALPELLYTPRAPLADDVTLRAAWVRALQRVPATVLEGLTGRVPPRDDLRAWMELARQVQALHATVAGAGLDFAAVAARCAAHTFDDGERWQLLAATQRAWADELHRMGRADLHVERMAALQEQRLTAPLAGAGQLWLVGVAEMPALVRRMLLALPAGVVEALVHAPPHMAPGFDPLGCVDPAFWAAAHVPLADDQLVVVDRPAEQAGALLRIIAGLDGAYAADDVAVAVPDPEVVPFLEERLGAAGVPCRYAGGRPLTLTPPATLLGVLADAAAEAAPAWAALLRHPDAGAWVQHAARTWDAPGAGTLRNRELPDGWLTPLDRGMAQRIPARMPGTWPVPPGDGLRSQGQDAVAALVEGVRRELLAPLQGRRPLGEWMPALLETLLAIYGIRELDRERPDQRALLGALTRIRDAAAALHRLPAGALECDAATAIRILIDDLRGVTLPPEPEEAAVELLGWLELHVDDSPVAIVTGASEPLFPESVNAHPFLPDSLRTHLGLEDNARRYARDAFHLTALLRSRERVCVVAGRRSAAGDPLRPSRLLLAVPGDALPRRVAGFYGAAGGTGQAQPAPGSSGAAPAQDTAPAEPPPPAAPGGFLLPPDRDIHLDTPPEGISVTAFRQILESPYLFVLDRNVKLDVLDDSAREMDPLGFGGLAHQLLEEFGRSGACTSSEPATVTAALDEALDNQAYRRFGRSPQPAVKLQVEQLRARLHAFARWQAQHVADGWRIVAVECGTPGVGVPFDVDGVPIRLSGRIDRIDHHAGSGQWAVFDYKTGDSVATPDGAHRRGRGEEREWVDLQLPLYRHILPFVEDRHGARVFDGPPGEATLAYIALCADLDQVGALAADWSAEELASADECARECVRLIRRGGFTWEPLKRFMDPDLAALLGIGRLSALEEDLDD
jgi:ATP-dependent helicase/nuclease subunit B